MEEKVLLEKNRSKYSVNKENGINLDLESKSRLLPFNNITTNFSLSQLYLDERDNCDKYRMIFSVNPICSNVLFNNRTEVVRYEGSDRCEVLLGNRNGDKGNAVNTTNLNYLQALRDTEYSHPQIFPNNIPYVYHCGIDIFNNHMLRNDDFVYVNKPDTTHKDVFNTIKDYVRVTTGSSATIGKTVREDVSPGFDYTTNKDIHLYQYDTVLSMYNAYISKLKSKDGWYGFNNSTNIAIPNVIIDGKEVSINKVMNDNKSCEFIDMYPDRSLYSFVPKLNKYRRRIEKNWDYCVCYPAFKDKDLVNTLCGIKNTITEYNGGSSVKIIEAKRTYSSSGSDVIRMKSLFKHNFNVGDYITLYYSLNSGITLDYFKTKIKIVGVGDYSGNEKNRYFTISYNDISSKFDILDNDTVVSGTTVPTFYYKKNVNGVDCEYYFRKFVRITKDNDGITNLSSEVNKLAYGENIYGDRMAQVVFTDDIDVTGIVDHRGKPLTELYFTVIKRNAGYKKWYEEENYTDKKIEFSHCFGKVTSGLDLPSEVYDYNVRKLHNVEISGITNYSDLFSVDSVYKDRKKPQVVEDDINYDSSYLYENGGTVADLVEYNPIEDVETVLEVVCHRFNTAQRETLNKKYSGITYDDIVSDDYDYKENQDSSEMGDGTLAGFNVSSYTINYSTYVKKLDNGQTNILRLEYPGNINLEGYFYNPYSKVKIKEVSEILQKVRGKVISITSNIRQRTIIIDDKEYNGIILNTVLDYGLIKNDVLGIYDNESKKLVWGTIYDVHGKYVDIIVNDESIVEDILSNYRKYTIVSTIEGVPSYATFLPSSHSFVWRPIILMSELSNNSQLFEMPFSNGRHYIESNVALYLRRQDPFGNYGLFNFDKDVKYKSNLSGYRIFGEAPVDLTVEQYNNVLDEICY